MLSLLSITFRIPSSSINCFGFTVILDLFSSMRSLDLQEKFEYLRSKGCKLIGPQCVLSCAKEHRCLPDRGYTCCLAMVGVKVLASGFEKDEKVKIEQLVTGMGGELHTKASLDIDFVVVKNVLAAKYKWALNVLKKPIVNMTWVYQCWTEHRIVPQEPFKVPPFSGLTVCVTRIPAGGLHTRCWKSCSFLTFSCKIPLPGFAQIHFCVSQYEEKDRILLRNLCHTLGAKFTEKLTKKVTHLICKFTSGPKYEAACKWGIHSVTAEWITECVKQETIVSLEPFWPKAATAQDREAGLCTVSQYPTQAAHMVIGNVSSQLLSDSQVPMECQNADTGVVPDNSIFTDPKNSKAFTKRPRLSESDSMNVTSHKNRMTGRSQGSSDAVPDVADAIEDLLAQSNKMQDMKSPGSSGCDRSTFSPQHPIIGQNHAGPHSNFEIARPWLSRRNFVNSSNKGNAQSAPQSTLQGQDLSQMLWAGPVPGDIAEIEAYCRIFRAAEQLHTVVMETLCNPETGECNVLYDTPSEDIPLLEQKVAAVLGCMIVLLNRGREDVLSGRSSFMNSFAETGILDDMLPPLALFRGEMKRCCESLHLALANYLTLDDDRSAIIWRRLHRLKNVCYDAGFSRGDDYPCPTLLANWGPVYFSISRIDKLLVDSEVAFWRGGQVTDEGLAWLLEKGFKTLVDLRDEAECDVYYQSLLRWSRLDQFASLVLDSSRRPIYLHSQEGVGRTSAMVSRWRQFTTCTTKHTHTFNSLNDKSSKNTMVDDGDLDLQNSIHQNLQGNKISEDKNHPEFPNPKFSDDILAIQDECQSSEAGNKLDFMHNTTSRSDVNGAYTGDVESSAGFSIVSDPLKAQFPTCDFFSRKEMTQFFKERKISPLTYLNSQRKMVEILPDSRKKQKYPVQGNEVLFGTTLSNLIQPGTSNGTSADGVLFLRT
ncbi:hypothetical protein J5N97_021140 [Dioscorea zingiberensis]|uniref:BRCT domain-containing protein n=1 Tax=Dioscorea zingiberensis TaxID=325984 RepID=A0A9D5CH38_9LILI|nr:hypothetical protein J5N97_021140 [Dioscorea zingiberensis]